MSSLTDEDVNLMINNIIKETLTVSSTIDDKNLTLEEKLDLAFLLKEYIFINIYAFHLSEMNFNVENYEENTTIH